jgi:uncharacterized membrane protein YsdA (DUF1294 family)
MDKLFILYLAGINLLGLYFMRTDKLRSKRGKYRIPERRFFMIALVGGSIGVFAGMRLFRHKTKHATFYVGIPAILFVQLILLGYAWARLAGS